MDPIQFPVAAVDEQEEEFCPFEESFESIRNDFAAIRNDIRRTRAQFHSDMCELKANMAELIAGQAEILSLARSLVIMAPVDALSKELAHKAAKESAIATLPWYFRLLA